MRHPRSSTSNSMSAISATGRFLQTKLRIGAPDDPFEHEADAPNTDA